MWNLGSMSYMNGCISHCGASSNTRAQSNPWNRIFDKDCCLVEGKGKCLTTYLLSADILQERAWLSASTIYTAVNVVVPLLCVSAFLSTVNQPFSTVNSVVFTLSFVNVIFSKL